MAKRGYSKSFTPKKRTPETRRRIDVDWVPLGLYRQIQQEAKRRGLSLRAFALEVFSAAIGKQS